MIRSSIFFSLSALLTALTFIPKTEHSYDMMLLVPIGLYFIVALLLSFRPQVEWSQQLLFAGLALLTWLVLFMASFSLFFFILVPISGAAGAWLIWFLSKRYLDLDTGKPLPIILAGLGTALAGLLFMIAVKELPKEIFTMGVKNAVITSLWQLGVGLMLTRGLIQATSPAPDRI